MRSRHIEQIEDLRKQIENLSIPIDKTKIKKKGIKDKVKENDKEKKLNDDLINKNFDEIYDLYNNDKEYKQKKEEEERLKNIKISFVGSINIKGKLNQEKKLKSQKFDFYECMDILEKNDHHGRHETNYEEDFSSSDSYDSDLFNLNQTAPKNFKFKTKGDLKNNQENLLEIVRVLKAYQQ